MSQDPGLRRLSAILAADVVGYSRLMGVDEAGTLARFRQRRTDIINPTVARFHGEIVGSAGDSLLVEFSNALAAVQCAVDLQHALQRANANEPEDRRILFRMGINLGDVIAVDNTIHGDGVNVAARLEKLADAGGLCIARNVFDQIDGKIDLGFTDLGEHVVKNIARPVRVYRAELGGATPARTAGSGPPSSAKVSIAVLPFDNLGDDPAQTYFSDGIAEDIITELSRFRELLVIARNSSFHFRGKSIDIKEVARKLGVAFVVEGSVRRAGNRIRLNVQLIETDSMAHVWAERYDRDMTDIFAIQDEVTRLVVTQVAGHARSAVTRRQRSHPTDNLSAYDHFLRGRQVWTPHDGAFLAEPFLVKAIELDPNLAVAHAMIGHVHCVRFYYDGNSDHLANALAVAGRALDLDPEEPWAHRTLGMALLFLRRFDEAGHALDRALALNGNDVTILADHALWLGFVNRIEPALQEIDEALRRDPYANDWFWDVRGAILTGAGRYREAIDSFRRVKRPTPWMLCYLAACHGELGEMTDAQAMVARFRQVSPTRTPQELMSKEPFSDPETSRRLIDAVRRAEHTG